MPAGPSGGYSLSGLALAAMVNLTQMKWMPSAHGLERISKEFLRPVGSFVPKNLLLKGA
jgi:hypothetical protein